MVPPEVELVARQPNTISLVAFRITALNKVNTSVSGFLFYVREGNNLIGAVPAERAEKLTPIGSQEQVH